MSRHASSIFLWFVCTSVAAAQVEGPARKIVSAHRRLTPREGEAIVSAAWQRSQETRRRPDCSHLVHEIYALAGYPYPYANSFELYTGTASFVRVAKPQAGDLVVWRGHVGIVIDPTEHSFYSSVRTGLRTEFYDAANWKGRGAVRFYRYVVERPPKITLMQERSPQTAREPVQVVPVPVDEDSSESPLTATQGREMSSGTATAARLDQEFSLQTHGPVEIPSSILVTSAQDRPTQEDLADAISELNDAAGDILWQEDFAQFGRKVIIYDELAVQRLEVKGQRGSANTRIESRVTLIGERIEQKRRHEKFQWTFLRTQQGWEVRAPKDRVYVQRDVAVRVLAARLASLTQDPVPSHTSTSLSAQARIVRLLNAVLQGI